MTGVLGRSVESIAGVLRAVFTAEAVASRDGFLQQRDPRVSLCSIAGLALAVMITRSIAVTLVFTLLTGLLARSSGVGLRRLLARAGVISLGAALAVLPQLVLFPGTPLFDVAGVAVTEAGLLYVLRFTLRVGTGVALLSLLVMTTPFSTIVAALRELHVPVTIVWVVAVAYRFLFLFFDELQRLLIARNSRRAGRPDVRSGWRDATKIAGTFLLRVIDRGQRVGLGMRARGGARAPSPYGRSGTLDLLDYGLVVLAGVAVVGTGVVQWVL